MLFESFYAISLPTDPIHREDWKGATKYILKDSSYRDGIIVLEPQFTYYKNKFKQTKVGRAKVLPSMEFLADTDLIIKGTFHVPINRIFIMDGYSMMQLNNERNEAIFTIKMEKQGFKKEKMVKFGGKDGHTVVYVFKRND